MSTTTADHPLFAGRAASLWQFAADHPVLSALIITIAQNGLTLWARDLWWADEVRHAGVVMRLLDEGDWLALGLNEEFYPDKPPLYFLFLAALMRVLSSREQWVVFLGLALTVLCFFLATYHLALRLLGDRRKALLALVIAATGSYLITLSHYARMDFLFTAFICMSWACFYDGIRENQANRSIVFGFLWSALAIMTKGPLGFAFPVLGVLGYLWWSRRLAILIRWDFAVGLAITAAVAALWAAGVVHFAGFDYLMHLLRGQIVERGLRSDNGVLEHARYFVTMPLVFLPWTLVFVSGWRWPGVGGTQPDEPRSALRAGAIFATGCLIIGFGLVSAIGEKHEYYLLPLLVLLCILTAERFTRLNASQRRRFWLWAALYFIAAGCALAIAGSLPATQALLASRYGASADGALTTGGFSVLLGLGLMVLRARAQPFLLLLMLAGQTIWINLLVLQVFASLNPIWSTRSVAEMARPFAEDGYSVGIRHGVRGVFTYHLGAPYTELGDVEGMKIWLRENPRSVIIMPKRAWRGFRSQFPTLRPVDCAGVAGLEMVLLSSDGVSGDDADCR